MNQFAYLRLTEGCGIVNVGGANPMMVRVISKDNDGTFTVQSNSALTGETVTITNVPADNLEFIE